MILAAHQPLFLGWLGYWAKIASADKFVIFDGVPFEHHGFSNRNKIKTAQGIQWLTVPVKHDNHLTRPICQTEIAGSQWKRKHLRAVELAYQKAPYFKDYFEHLQAIYSKDWHYLAGLNRALLDWVLLSLGIQIPIITASEQCFEGSKSELVLDMCKKLGAKKYIFGPLGKNYADIESFTKAGIEVQFQTFQSPVYPQLHGEFVPNLSVIDLLMNCGPDSLAVIKGEK